MKLSDLNEDNFTTSLLPTNRKQPPRIIAQTRIGPKTPDYPFFFNFYFYFFKNVSVARHHPQHIWGGRRATQMGWGWPARPDTTHMWWPASHPTWAGRVAARATPTHGVARWPPEICWRWPRAATQPMWVARRPPQMSWGWLLATPSE
jgi:hypothetical protein